MHRQHWFNVLTGKTVHVWLFGKKEGAILQLEEKERTMAEGKSITELRIDLACTEF